MVQEMYLGDFIDIMKSKSVPQVPDKVSCPFSVPVIVTTTSFQELYLVLLSKIVQPKIFQAG